MKHLFGPVKSRRLGISLGVDLLSMPRKTCTLNCLYCQLGPEQTVTTLRKIYAPKEELLAELAAFLKKGPTADYITLSGRGEPTLHSQIGEIIRRIKALTDVPVAVITNGTLLYRPGVRRALMAADVVLPSLDAVSDVVFQRVNRPSGQVTGRRLREGLQKFSREYPGKIFLEIMLVKECNDSPAELEKLRNILKDIRADRVQLNTVARPPAEKIARALTRAEMKQAAKIIGYRCEIIADFPDESVNVKPQKKQAANARELIIATLRRRPLSQNELVLASKSNPPAIERLLKELEREGMVTVETVARKKYYRLSPRQ